jgi:hypothetical protein
LGFIPPHIQIIFSTIKDAHGKNPALNIVANQCAKPQEQAHHVDFKNPVTGKVEK